MMIKAMAASASVSRLLIPVSVSKNRQVLSSLTLFRKAFSTTGTSASPDQPPQPRFYVPKGERGNRPAFEIDYMVGETRLARNSRTCPTRELNFGHLTWQRHKSPYRKFRHMANFFRQASLQRLLFPDLFCISTLAGCLTYYNEFVAASNHFITIGMSPSAFAGATTAIGLLAGFRLNASYARVKEGRKYFSDISTTTRDLSRHTLMWMKHNKDKDEQLNHYQIRMLRLCQAFPIALMFHLNDKGCHHNMKRKSKKDEAPFKDRVQAEFRAELSDVFHQNKEENDIGILKNDFERISRVKAQGGNAPLEVLTCMGEILAACDDHKVNPIYVRELDNQVQRLCQALGSSERVVKTPLPTGFTRHSSRLLFIWSNCLPFALYPVLGPLGTMPTTLLTAYAVLGIEDISVQLEEPFDILPLRQYSDGIFDSIRAIEEGYTSNYASAVADGGNNVN